MALGALNTGANVPFVGKIDKIWKVMDFLPWHRFVGFPELCQLHDFGRIRPNMSVTTHTHLYGRNTSDIAVSAIGMAVLAVHSEHGDVAVMGKGDGLLNGITGDGTGSHLADLTPNFSSAVFGGGIVASIFPMRVRGCGMLGVGSRFIGVFDSLPLHGNVHGRARFDGVKLALFSGVWRIGLARGEQKREASSGGH